jgi:DNA-binding NtrC family response regulator
VVQVPGRPAGDTVVDTAKSLAEVLEPQIAAVERAYLEACLRQCRGRIGESAQRAGISRRTLLRKLKQYGIDKKAFREGERATSS